LKRIWLRGRRIAIRCAVAALCLSGPQRGGIAQERQHKPAKFDVRTTAFAVAFNGEISAYREMSAFVLPDASLIFEAVNGPPGDYALRASAGEASTVAPRKWRWRAPTDAGLYPLRFDGPGERDAITLNVFVMVPSREVRNGFLNGYRIGEYPATPLKGNPIYKPPLGFVEVTKAIQDTHVSPHFRLKQFLCKDDTSDRFPKYVVLKERLLLKLESILERVNAAGFAVETLHVMSAYRTPFYNKAIGDVAYSMHQWGSAADIYVDKHNKDRMDDLNGDGKVDVEDARYLYDMIEKMLSDLPFARFQGGMGFYRGTSAHPPFVHVDVRGFRARWEG
jgi:hypothetical protein